MGDGTTPKIEHVVVLMLENRSFDNLLGWLYDPRNDPPYNEVPPGQSFAGLDDNAPSCPWNGTSYPPVHGADTTQPCPDPNELYANMYVQMFNPSGYAPGDPVPDMAGKTASMQGYVADYATVKDAQAPNIMSCFRPVDVPVISMLANSYAVCDHWFASVPSQTYTNRSFLHAGTASGYVNNRLGDHFWDGCFVNKTPTIFNLLQQQKPPVPWKIYYGGLSALCQVARYQEQLENYRSDGPQPQMYPMSQFFTDVEAGIKDPATFPSYVFIEPNFLGGFGAGPENDEHPQAAPTDFDGLSNVLSGEALIAEIFNALSANNNQLWQSTMFVLLFDEGGGTYDHLPPPVTAIAPDNVTIAKGLPGYSGFTFDRYGARVPAIVCSPLIAKSTVCNTVFDHTSIIRTVINLFLAPGTHLGCRDKAATDLLGLVTLSTPRTDAPVLVPVKQADFDPNSIAAAPLNDLQQDLVAGAIRDAFGDAFGVSSAPPLVTHADAWAALQRIGQAN